MFEIARWHYLIYAALAAFITALKGFFYAHLLNEVQYAGVNYYLLILGVGVLLVGSGVMVRCHTELPLLVKGDTQELRGFVGQVKGMGFLFWLVLCVLVLFGGQAVDLALPLQMLSVVQVLVFFLFTVDLMIIKSRLDFLGYARQLFARNAVIAAAGFSAAYLTADAVGTVAAEVACAILIYSRGLVAFIRVQRLPSEQFFFQSLAYVPVTLVGALLQFVDRLLASSVLKAEDFSRFSYFSLIILAGLSIQQLVNTRIITVLPAMCEVDARAGFRYTLKASAGMALVMFVVLTLGMLILQSPWFAAAWFESDYLLGFLFVLIALVRAVDFYTSYLLVMGRKLLLFSMQLAGLLFFCSGVLIFNVQYAATGLRGLVWVMLIGFSMLLLALIIAAWRVSGVGENSE
ncbi:hypothetical protein ABXV19_15990 [Pseudomonas alkylphenolica]|uniref:hypothetical protein n=1 Tax=Pseudomonas alkylphenolica TaxID=237609 RepID=UPI003390A5E9